jgi:hypothetical protein
MNRTEGRRDRRREEGLRQKPDAMPVSISISISILSRNKLRLSFC